MFEAYKGPVSPPKTVCIFRRGGLGDIACALPVVETIRSAWPAAKVTWVIDPSGTKLLAGYREVRFVQPWPRRRYDLLVRLDSARPCQIEAGQTIIASRAVHGQHRADTFRDCLKPLGLRCTAPPIFPLDAKADAWARAVLPAGAPLLLISPCASQESRDWRPERFAAVADHAISAGWRVALIGGPTPRERKTADAILAAMQAPALDLVGQGGLPALPALLARGTALLSPDSGPVHVADALGLKVIALHAVTNPEHSGPYSDRRFVVDCYQEAVKMLRTPEQVAWGKRIDAPGVMDLVTVDAVIAAFEKAAYVCRIG